MEEETKAGEMQLAIPIARMEVERVSYLASDHLQASRATASGCARPSSSTSMCSKGLVAPNPKGTSNPAENAVEERCIKH